MRTDELREQLASILFNGKSPISLEADEREKLDELMNSIMEHTEYVIGGDELMPVDDRGWENIQSRNGLRAEQRNRAGGY